MFCAFVCGVTGVCGCFGLVKRNRIGQECSAYDLVSLRLPSAVVWSQPFIAVTFSF